MLNSFTFTDPPYTVAPFLPQGGIAVLHGPPGIGKSQLALTMAAAISRGEPFLTPEHPTSVGPVVYVQLNMVARLQQDRLRQAQLNGTLPLYFLLPESGMLDSEHLIPSRDPGLNEAVKVAPRLVIVDTLRDAHHLDESESDTVTKVYGAWRTVFPAATLLFVHHDRKMPAVEHGAVSERYWLEAARGSSTWLGNADCGLQLTDAKKALTLLFSKVRTCGPLPPYAVRLNEQTLLVELAEPTARQRVLGWLVEHPHGTKEEAARWLTQEIKVSRQRAHALVREIM